MEASKAIILNTFQVVFPEVNLYPRQIPVFRGAIAEWAGWDNDYFHNHLSEEQVVYRYPLIQYRSVEGRGCLYALQEGVTALQQALFRPGDHCIESKEGALNLNYYSISNQQHELKLLDGWAVYYLNDWLALNTDNYQKWKQNPRLMQRAMLLEEILAGHLLGFAAGIGWRLPERSIQVEVMDIYQQRKVKVHGADSIAFNIRYRANLLLPDDIGLGRSVSHGFGVQNKMRVRNKRAGKVTVDQLLQEVR